MESALLPAAVEWDSTPTMTPATSTLVVAPSITALANSDGLKGLGQDSPIDGAAAIAAIYVAQDLFSDATKPFDKVPTTAPPRRCRSG